MIGVAKAFSRIAADAPAPPPRLENRLSPQARHPIMLGMIWILTLLMIVPDGFDYRALATELPPVAGSVTSRLLWLLLLGGSLIIITTHLARALKVIRWLNPFLLGFVFLALTSMAWSLDPVVTGRRMIRIVTIVSCSIAFVLVGWNGRNFQNALRPVITAVLLGSIVFGIVWPDLGIHDDGILVGAWRGLTNHKNGLGEISCVGLLLWCHAGLSRESRILSAWIGGGLAVACLLLSRSSTSLVVTVFTLLFMILLMRSPPVIRRYLPYVITVFIIGLAVYSLALLQILPGLHMLMSPIGEVTGKDMTFTGRTDIWEIISDHIRLNPILGSGYGAYWTGIEQGTPSFDFILRLDFYPGSAHNGYLDVLNDLGAIGLLTLLGYLIHFLTQSLGLLQIDRNQASLYLALFLQQAITNLAESRWFSALSVDFVIMTLATTSLARAILEHHRVLFYRGLSEVSHELSPATTNITGRSSSVGIHASTL